MRPIKSSTESTVACLRGIFPPFPRVRKSLLQHLTSDCLSTLFTTHLSCKFSSFSYSPSLLQQLTTFGISAASVINSYENSTNKLQINRVRYVVHRTENLQRFQSISNIVKISFTWQERWSCCHSLTLKSTSIPSNRLESSGSWLRISSEPIKILSKWDQVLCTSNQMEITESDTDSFFCHKETSSKKCPMYLDVMRFWSCTWKKRHTYSLN